jgi:hypothetical protein
MSFSTLPGTYGQGDEVTISGDVSPTTIDEGQTSTISVTISNGGDADLENVWLEYYVYQGTIKSTPDKQTGIPVIPMDGERVESFTWSGKKKGTYTVTIRLIDEQDNVIEQMELGDKITVKEVITIEENPLFTPLFGLPLLYWIIIIVILVIVIAAAGAAAKKRKKKKQVDLFGGPVEGIEARPHWGKMPENYYKERRDRLAKLKPVGLTRDGRTIMGNPQASQQGQTVMAETPTQQVETKICPKCSMEMPGEWKSCLKCDANEVYDNAFKTIREISNTGADTGMADDVLRQADTAMDAGNWVEAEMFASDAKKKALEAKSKHEAAQKAIKQATQTQAEGGDVVQHSVEAEKDAPKGPDNCTNCGMGMQPDWDKCPVCGVTVEQMLAKPEEKPEEKPVEEKPAEVVDDTPKCHQCGTPLEGGSCKRCNAERAVWNAEKKVKALKAKAVGLDIPSETKLDLNEAVDLFEDAKGALMDGDYTTAIGLAGEAIDMTEVVTKKLDGLGTAPPAPKPAPAEPKPGPAAEAGPKCSNCGRELKPGWSMCPGCETPVQTEAPSQPKAEEKPTCPHCGKNVKPKWSMCPFCEKSLH